MVRKNCENCGKFYWSLKSKNRKYCSRSCAGQQQPTKKVKINCDGCGKSIERTLSLLNQNKGNYCSSECFYKNGRKGKIVECDNCGKEVYKNPSELNKWDGTFCSLECFYGSDNHTKSIYPNTAKLRIKIKKRNRRRRLVNILADPYIKDLLTHNNNMGHNDIPQSIVEAKRQNLKIKRLIRNKD